MKISQSVLTEISQITRDIEENYPELQKYLDETPITLSEGPSQNPDLDDKTLTEYRDSLKEMVRKYKKEH